MTAAGERGSALLAALGLLSAITLLATMSLLAAGADLTIAARRARERSAFYAAESALETTLAELAGSGCPIPEASLHEPWPAPEVPIREWRDGAWECVRRICLIPDAADADADPSTPFVLFNRGFGHGASPLHHGGAPVVQVLVEARSGETRQGIVAEVAAVTCNARVEAAWLAAGGLTLSGDILVLGAATLPALAARTPVRLLDGAAVEGEQVVDPLLALPADVLSLLEAGGTLARLEELPEPPADGALNGVFWSRGDYSGPLHGQGILVVHNPAFDPVRHEASRVAIEEGRLVEERDPDYSHLDPSRQPARLQLVGDGSFSGLVVADTVGDPAAPFSLTGALVTLTRSPLTVASSPALRITGSRSAVERAGRGPLRFLAAFRPVTAGAERPGPCP